MDVDPEYENLNPEVSRPPSVEDLVRLCAALNDKGARYVVVGGFAIRGAGYIRETMEVKFFPAPCLCPLIWIICSQGSGVGSGGVFGSGVCSGSRRSCAGKP